MKALQMAKRPALILITLLLLLTAGSTLAKDATHGYLGVMLQNISGSMAKALQLEEGQGVLINKVVDDGPAAKSGLEDGDVILKFNGKPIDEYSDLTKAVRATAPGDNAKLEILHNGKRQTAHVEMGEAKGNSFSYAFRSDHDAPDVEYFNEGAEHGNVWIDDDGDDALKTIQIELMGMDEDCGFMGVELDDLNEQLGDYFGVADGEGALISKVNEDSPAAKAGLRAGDVIVQVNGEAIDDSGEVHEAMSDTKPEQEIKVRIVRKGKQKTMKITLGEVPESSFSRHLMHFGSGGDSPFPEGLEHNVRVMAPHGMRGIHGRHNVRVLQDNDENLAEVHEELNKLREELEQLKSDLKK